MICRNCGAEFELKNRGRKNTGFCCKHCADSWRQHNKYDLMPKKYTKTCIHCGTVFQTNRQNQMYCTAECGHAAKRTGRTIYTKTCLYCGHEFQTINKDHKYCSSTCASRDAGDKRRGKYFCEYCGKPRWSDHPNRNRFCSRECVNKAKHLETLERQEEQRRQREKEMTRQCAFCGEIFIARQGVQRFCSGACQYVFALEEQHKRNVAKFVPTISTCLHCGKPFITTFGSRRTQYCSDKCSQGEHRDRYNETRKEQMSRAFVEPVGLKTTFKAYNGMCAICGLPVPYDSDPANQWGPTVDHIVPLSKGGAHERVNCQLAHRLCNSLKLDTEKDYHISWSKKLVEEPGRWNAQLDDLWSQVGLEAAQ